MRHRVRLCLKIQGPIISKLGFEASRKGVQQSVMAYIRCLAKLSPHGRAALDERMKRIDWLVDPDIQALAPRGQAVRISSYQMQVMNGTGVAASEAWKDAGGEENQSSHEVGAAASIEKWPYHVLITDVENEAALKGVDTCRAAMAGTPRIAQRPFPWSETRRM